MSPSLIMQAEPWTIFKKEKDQDGNERFVEKMDERGNMQRIVERMGYTLTYFDPESKHIGQKVGYEPLRISGAAEVVTPALGAIPGWFHMHYRMRANRDSGKAELQLTGLDYAGSFEFAEPEQLA